MFEKEGGEELPKCLERNNNQPLESLMFIEDEISKAIGCIKITKSPGQDKDNTYKKLKKKSVVKKPLELLFDKSLEEGRNPTIWNKINVTAIL